MKARFVTAIICVLSVCLLLKLLWHPSPEKSAPPPEKKVSQDAAVAGALAKQNLATLAVIESNFARVQTPQGRAEPIAAAVTAVSASGQPSSLQFTNYEPATVLENMRRAIHQYGDMFGGNPVGNNAEITSQLSGDNPKHINFISAEAGMRINSNGELIDPWGTPYFFHQLSGTEMEIHSAGPNRIMWTADDLVVR